MSVYGMYLVWMSSCHIVLLSFGSCGPTASLVPINDQCICPGDTLRINCTAVGDGVTTWAGTAFTRITCSQISLGHSQYPTLIDSGAPRFCPNMVMVIRALSVDGSCYTSQLTIPSVTAEFNGSTITCQRDAEETTNIGMYNIIYTTGEREREREGGRERERERERGSLVLTFH